MTWLLLTRQRHELHKWFMVGWSRNDFVIKRILITYFTHHCLHHSSYYTQQNNFTYYFKQYLLVIRELFHKTRYNVKTNITWQWADFWKQLPDDITTPHLGGHCNFISSGHILLVLISYSRLLIFCTRPLNSTIQINNTII